MIVLGILQRGHIYTSSGSFFIEPIEEYTLDNQNILHKISREKLPMDKMSFDKFRNGKLLVDEMGLHEDDAEKVDESSTGDLNPEFEEEFESNESNLDGLTADNNGTYGVDCRAENGKSK